MKKRQMAIGNVSLLIMIVALFGLFLIPNDAQGESGSDTIHEDYYVIHPISFHSGKHIKISYTMALTDGPNIDVYFLDSQNYQYYQDGVNFDYYIAMSDEDTRYASNQITLYDHDTYYLVFDNTDIGTDPPWNMIDDVAYVDYTITTTTKYASGTEGEDILSIIASFIILIVVFVIIVALSAFYMSRKRKQTSTQTPQTTYQREVTVPQAPKQQPYQQPEYPPPPPPPQEDRYQPQQTQQQSQIRYCHSCGRQIPFDSIFCPYCEVEQQKTS